MSLQRANATVVAVDDPEHKGRIKVRPDKLPDIDINLLPWVYPRIRTANITVGARVIY